MTTNKIQLHSLATPNGQKISIALEEMGIEYDAHTVNITKDEQFTPEFLAINPNNKIPAIVDPSGPNGKPFNVFESGAILIYLAEKSGKFLPEDSAKKSETLQWLMWQMGGLGPMFGQFGHFTKYASKEHDLTYGQTRYTNEAKRLLNVLEKQLEGKDYVIGDDLTIADFAIMPWIVYLDVFYGAKETLELESYPNINRWKDSLLACPAVQKGMDVCGF